VTGACDIKSRDLDMTREVWWEQYIQYGAHLIAFFRDVYDRGI